MGFEDLPEETTAENYRHAVAASEALTLARSKLQILPTDTDEDIVATRMFFKAIAAQARDYLRDYEEMMVERIEETGQNIEVEGVRYYAGYNKSEKVRDRVQVLSFLASEAATLEDIDEVLVAQPFKPGAFGGKYGDEERGRFFEKVSTPKLKEGKPTKMLKQAPTIGLVRTTKRSRS